MEGAVSLLSGTFEIKKLSKGDWFGEEALQESIPRKYTAKCLSEIVNFKYFSQIVYANKVKCIEMSRERLQNIVGKSLNMMVYRNIQIKAIKNSVIGPKLTTSQIERIADMLEIKPYADGAVVVRKGSMAGMKLFIVLEGEYVRTVILFLSRYINKICFSALKSKSNSVVAYKGTLFGAGHLGSGNAVK